MYTNLPVVPNLLSRKGHWICKDSKEKSLLLAPMREVRGYRMQCFSTKIATHVNSRGQPPSRSDNFFHIVRVVIAQFVLTVSAFKSHICWCIQRSGSMLRAPSCSCHMPSPVPCTIGHAIDLTGSKRPQRDSCSPYCFCSILVLICSTFSSAFCHKPPSSTV